MSKAPWTVDQVASLNAFQVCGYWHPFTWGDGKDLIATEAGWVIETGGTVVQDWAHSFMLDWSWKENGPPWIRGEGGS